MNFQLQLYHGFTTLQVIDTILPAVLQNPFSFSTIPPHCPDDDFLGR